MSDHLKKLFESCPDLPWSFTPLNGKIPINKGWQKAPHETREQALRWAARGNIGLRTGEASGGLLVVDLDVDKGEYDVATVRGLRLPKTITAKTGSGGWHLYFQLPEGVALGNTSGRLAAAVDTRGDGGQVVFPGSRHPDNGNLYTWMPGHAPWEVALAELPPHILSLLASDTPGPPTGTQPGKTGRGKTTCEPPGASAYVKAAVAAELANVSQAAEGTRNHTLNAAAFSLGQLVGGGVLGEQEATSGLMGAALGVGLTKTEAAATIASGIASGKQSPRTPPPPAPGQSRGTTAVPPPDDTEDGGAVDENGVVKLGHRDPETQALVLSPKRTLPTARAFIREHATHKRTGGRMIHSYAGGLFKWKNNRYVEAEDGAVRHRLLPWLHAAKRRVYQDGKYKLVPFDCNPSTVTAALETIRAAVHLNASREVPFWVSGDGAQDPREMLLCRNSNLHIPTGAVTRPTPDLFAFNALDFDYDPGAQPPSAWLAFLRQLWPQDSGAVELLQEWFGYCLTADTSQQKMLLMVGPKRSGKGTIGRVLAELIGRGNVAGPTTGSLAGAFGLAPLLGKSLALVSDARFAGPDMQTVVERLLCISGEDTITIDRKHVDSVTVKLPTRFMFLTNELPRLRDAAGALAGRFLIVTLTESFYGREDPQLTRRLLGELPGILLWALQGWTRLHERGRFVVPESSQDSADLLIDLLSPVSAFVRECCIEDPGEKVLVSNLYDAWVAWCEAGGRGKFAGTVQEFGRQLKSARPSLKMSRNQKYGRSYIGIALKANGVLLEGGGE